MLYCAISTSNWCPGNVSDESFCSTSFEEALSWCLKRQDRSKSASIIKCEGDKDEKETEIVSFRTIK